MITSKAIAHLQKLGYKITKEEKKTLIINGIEYEKETHDFDKKLSDIQIPKGWRVVIKMNWYMLFSILAFLGMIVLVILIGGVALDTTKQQVTNIECCNGMTCSDTYYTGQDNLCHLSLCENSFFTDKKSCTYEGANKSITLE